MENDEKLEAKISRIQFNIIKKLRDLHPQ